MATTEERMKIIKMVEDGQISAEEAAKLLRALDSSGKQPVRVATESQPRWFRVRVLDLDTGKDKVNVNLPISLVHVGLRMGAKFAPEMEGFDMEELSEALRSGMIGKIVDVVNEQEGERVEIYVE